MSGIQLKIVRHAKQQVNMTMIRGKETDLEMTHKLELLGEEVKSVIPAIIPMSKKIEESMSMLRRDLENITKSNF